MIATAAGVINAAQSYLQHSSSINISNSNTNDQLKQNLDFNKQNLKQNKDHHTIQYSHSLMAAKREATRDMWAQINHKNQTKLHGYDKFFKNLTDLYIDKKLPKKIILSGPKGIGKSTLSYHLVNYIFSADEKNKYENLDWFFL